MATQKHHLTTKFSVLLFERFLRNGDFVKTSVRLVVTTVTVHALLLDICLPKDVSPLRD